MMHHRTQAFFWPPSRPSIKHFVGNLTSLDQSRRKLHPVLSKLEACTNLKQFKQVHAHTITGGLFGSVFAASRLLKFAATSLSPLDLSLVDLVFSQIHQPDVFCYNLVIKARSLDSSRPLSSLSLHRNLLLRGLCPNEYTFCFLLDCCSRGLALREGRQVHAQLKKHGLEEATFSGTSLVHMYGGCGALPDALGVFDQLRQRSDVSWSAIIDACISNGEAMVGLSLFHEMRILGVEPNNATLVNVLCACGEQGDLVVGRQVHAHIAVRGIELKITLGTSLVNMYLKSGEIDIAVQVFAEMQQRSVPSWNCLIHGLAMNCHATRALALFTEMVAEEDTAPNSITFLAVLHACSHAGLVEDGMKYFSLMSEVYGISPNIKHYGCLVDLLARAGRVAEAIEIVRTMPMKADIVIWGALLGACRSHGCGLLKELLAAQFVKISPSDSSGYLLLSDTYATADRWIDVARVREVMKEMDIRKIAGCSSLVDRDLHIQEIIQF